MVSVTELMTRVRSIINEYVGGTDDFVIESEGILKELITQAAQEVVSIAPNYYCTMSTECNDNVIKRADGRYVLLFAIPDGMIRPVQVTSTSLLRPIHDFIPVEDPRYAQQHSSMPGIGAGHYRPLAFVRGGESAEIEAHSVNEESATGTLYYIGMPTVTENESGTDSSINVNSVLEPAIALKAAQLMLEAERSESAPIVERHYQDAIKAWT